jgi:ribonuclease E
MEKNLYIDASHPDETRVVLKSDIGIEEYEYEDKNRLNFKNNIYLGTVSRVEPSLQAAFINFGRIKHGFLAFNDIQSDYYQIPTEDKEQLQEVEEKIREDLKNKNVEDINNDLKHENEDDLEKKDKQDQPQNENVASPVEEKQDENVQEKLKK